MEFWDSSRIPKTVVRQASPTVKPVEVRLTLSCHCFYVIFFGPKCHFVMNKYLYYCHLVIILLLYVWFEHPGHTYGGFVSSFSERGMTQSKANNHWPYWPYMLSLSSIHTGMHALILLPKPHTLGIWVHTWLVMLRDAVMNLVQVFLSLWCWVWLVLLLRVLVFHPSWCEMTVVRSLPWFKHGLEWWRRSDSVSWCGLSCSNLLCTES
jgi:hypothetical protein